MKYSYFLFDFDGTLLDSDFMIALTMHELYREYRPGYKPHLKDMLAFSGPPLLMTMKQEFPHMDPEFMRQEFVKRSKKYYEDTACLYPGAAEFLGYLREKGAKLGLVTSKMRQATVLSLDLVNLRNAFDAVVAGDDVIHNKPDPEPLVLCLEKMGHEGSLDDVLYVGDSEFDERAALALGVDYARACFAPRKTLSDFAPKYSFSSYDELKDAIDG